MVSVCCSVFDSLPASLYSSAFERLTSSVLKKLNGHETQVITVALRPIVDLVYSLMENFKLGK
jgi:hypothetical protein